MFFGELSFKNKFNAMSSMRINVIYLTNKNFNVHPSSDVFCLFLDKKIMAGFNKTVHCVSVY